MSIVLNGTKGINQNTTEVTKIPVGTTAQRPENPEAGMIRFNTDEGYVEWYDDVVDIWTPISEPPSVIATGGTVTDITQAGLNYRVHTFTSDGTFNVTRGGEVEYLIVAGGGSGGGTNTDSNRSPGGGGAGGLLTGQATVSMSVYPVVVGAGGAQPLDDATRNDGDNSSWNSFVAVGGGAGSPSSNRGAGNNGGSGGGGNEFNDGGLGTEGQGNNGGAGRDDGVQASGGGGGAGAVGQDATTTNSGNGGAGVSSTITGATVFYAGGGGGGRGQFNPNPSGTGGVGGGGDGGATGQEGNPGAPNTGGGGGGSARPSSGVNNGSAGGSGIVIVRYKIG